MLSLRHKTMNYKEHFLDNYMEQQKLTLSKREFAVILEAIISKTRSPFNWFKSARKLADEALREAGK